MTHSIKPLDKFNFALVQEPLSGLLRNVEGDLRKRVEYITRTDDLNEQKRMILLTIMLRFAINSYQSVGFLLSDLDEHPKRIPTYKSTANGFVALPGLHHGRFGLSRPCIGDLVHNF